MRERSRLIDAFILIGIIIIAGLIIAGNLT